MSNEERAYQRVKEKKGFYVHLSVYLAMAVFFFLLNVTTMDYPGDWWFYWPLMGWGIGVLLHYFNVFGLPVTKALTKEWEEKELRKELAKLQEEEKEEDPTDDHLELRDRSKEKIPSTSRPWSDEDLV
ncbi:MAG: 2TM domain-containing protein [Saprospiraceae bacterium]|nr:2TM domain-containing protein [Saprospiraceae bacterium]